MLSDEGNEKGKKNSNWSNWQNINFARAAHFFVHFLAVVLHDYNMKLPEISHLQVLCWKCRMRFCSPF